MRKSTLPIAKQKIKAERQKQNAIIQNVYKTYYDIRVASLVYESCQDIPEKTSNNSK